jgi:hypothetical protein
MKKLINILGFLVVDVALLYNYLILVSSDTDRATKTFGAPLTVLAHAAVTKIFNDEGEQEESKS